MSPTPTPPRRYVALMDPLPLDYITHDELDKGSWPTARAQESASYNGWRMRHNNAITGPRPNEAGIVAILRGWLTYADQYETQFSFSTSPSECRAMSPFDWDNEEAQLSGMEQQPRCGDCEYKDNDTTPEPMREESFLSYCQSCNACNGGRIGSDGVLGVAWAKMGRQLRNLLCGDLGRLDGGTLDGIILSAFAQAGLNEEGE